jgi:O-antigen/teichoic acid export membrane protein
MYQQLIKNTLFNAVGRFGMIVSSIILTPIIISTLGNDRFAIWSLVTMVISYIGFLDFGIGGSYSKYIAEFHAKNDLDKINGVIVCGLGLYSLISIIVIGTGIPLIQLMPRIFNISEELQPEALAAFRIGLIVFVVASTFDVFEAVPVGLQKMEYNNLVQFIIAILFTVTSIFYLNAGGGLVGLMVIRATTTAIQIILLYICAKKVLPSLNLSPIFFNLTQAKEMVNFGLKVQAGKLANIGTLNINRILIGFFVGLNGITNYQIGSTIVQGVREITMLTFSGITPMASQIHSQDRRQDLRNLYHNGTRVSLLVTAAGFGLICAIADPIIVFWTGNHYPMAAMLLVSLALANFFHVSTGTGTCLARGIGKPGLETLFGIILLFINILLGLFFGKAWGLDGILAATLIAYITSSLFFMFYFNRVIGIPNASYFRRVILPPTLAMISSLLVGMIMNRFYTIINYPTENVNRLYVLGNILLRGSLFFVLFFLITLLTGFIRLRHFRILVDYFRNSPFKKLVPNWHESKN